VSDRGRATTYRAFMERAVDHRIVRRLATHAIACHAAMPLM
jgi:hypothetical protein